MDLEPGGTIVPWDAALSSGSKTYFTGEPCKNGHIAKRRTRDKRCLQCLSEKWKRRYAIHAERYIATAKRHYKMDPERVKDRSRRWYYENIPRVRANKKRYYYQHREELIAAVARWAADNPVRSRATKVNVKLRARGIPGTITADDIMALMERQNGKCFCGIGFINEFSVDHIVPLSKGGTNVPGNIQLLCKSCNNSKGQKLDAEWKASRGF